ncbi:MAG TPA: response regulator [Ohtaekwangia sp.]|nr:response regulator [Ohtaekwangia sp.]
MNTFTCFLIDDDTDDQEIFCTVLGSLFPKIICITAGNGQVALDKLLSGEVSPDVIFLDLNMPLMNGRQFLKEVNRHTRLCSIPVTVLSTSADQDTKASVLELGARQFITKPDKYSEWETMLCEILNDFQIKT